MKKILLFVLFITGCSVNGRLNYIEDYKAKVIALADAGLSSENVSFETISLKTEGNITYYEVDFSFEGNSYDYDIDAYTGKIISKSNDIKENIAKQEQVIPTQTEKPQVAQTQVSNDYIGEEKAKTIAIEHSKVSNVTYTKVKLDLDDGIYKYEIEFYTDDFKEYDYEINAKTGEVISYDYDAESYASNTQVVNEKISLEQAKEIALKQVPGATVSDIKHIEFDLEDGKIEYDGKIIYNNLEYEFSIDGYSGAIRSWEVDNID